MILNMNKFSFSASQPSSSIHRKNGVENFVHCSLTRIYIFVTCAHVMLIMNLHAQFVTHLLKVRKTW